MPESIDKNDMKTSGGNPKLSVVIVHWNTELELRGCVESLLLAGGPAMEIIVIDNASEHIDDIKWSEYPKNVRLIRNARNEGYAKATNQGFRAASGEFVLSLNPDIVVNAEGLSKLIGICEAEGIAVATARLDFPDGTFQRYYNRLPGPWVMAARFTVLEPLFRNSRVVREYLMYDMQPDERRTVEQAPGACLLLSRGALEDAGLMDERFPLFMNDVDYCLRLKDKGYGIEYIPDARFTHNAQMSVNKMPAAVRKAEMHVSIIRYAAKHFGVFSAMALKCLFLIEAKARLFATIAQALTGRKNAAEIKSAWKAAWMVFLSKSIFD